MEENPLMKGSGEAVSARILVGGRVQGVGFRNYTMRNAMGLQLRGYARNLTDGQVEIEVEGKRGNIHALIECLWKGPPRAGVTKVEVVWKSPSSDFDQFSITVYPTI